VFKLRHSRLYEKQIKISKLIRIKILFTWSRPNVHQNCGQGFRLLTADRREQIQKPSKWMKTTAISWISFKSIIKEIQPKLPEEG
jgi:hypothetical protein